MPKKTPIDRVYTTQIAPLEKALKRICRDNNICMLTAFAVPLTAAEGAVMLNMQANKDGAVPTPFREAYLVLEERAPMAAGQPAG